ncbi:MAG: hypothetical protein IJ155_02035 [Prevotella sp.]|nr:hypothetical protein [Prevotella sp.]
MLDLLRQDAKIGDSLNLYLTTGDSVRGIILEIGENYLLMEVDGVKRRYFPQLIGGWDVVKNNPQTETLQTSEEQLTDIENQDKEETEEEDYNDILISLFDSIYEAEHINLSANIKTNAVVDKVSSTGVSVISDSGETFVCHKGFMVGFSRANCTPGKRLFCGNVNNTGPQNGICFISVLQMSFAEMRERFIQALSAKTGPRKPIINSIIAYFRKNNSGRNTKKIIADLRNRVSLLGTSNKVGNSKLDKYISLKQYDKAIEYLERLINASEDDKQKSALLLRKAQLYSSLKDHENAITAYRELISFNESINSPSKNLSHLYTELARLLFLTGDNEQAENARNIALMLNPQNSIARKIGGQEKSKDSAEGETAETFVTDSKGNEDLPPIVKFTDKSLIDDDIERYTFTDSEIVSLNGEVSSDIANRLLEKASTSDDYILHIEAAKALKHLPIGSYDIQDLEDSIANYSINKCYALFNSYRKVIFESDSVEGISIEQLNKIKDSVISFSLEVIENIIDEDSVTATQLLTNSLLLELSSLLIVQKQKRDIVLDVLDYSLENFVEFCTNPTKVDVLSNLVVKLLNYSVQCSRLWEEVIVKSHQYESFLNSANNNVLVKKELIRIATLPKIKRDVNNPNFLMIVRKHESNRLNMCYNQLKKITNMQLDVTSVRLLQTRCNNLIGRKRIWCFNETDKKSLTSINHLVSLLSMYQARNKEERKDILANAKLEIDEIIKWNSGTITTVLGRFCFYPLLSSWKESISKLNAQDEYKDSCLLTFEMDSPYYVVNSDNSKSVNVIVYNNSNLISEGYKLAIWIGSNRKDGIFKHDDKFILPNSNVLINILIPQEKWGDLKTYELNFAISSRYQGRWSTTVFANATITSKRDIGFNKADIKWKDSGNPPVEMFKGRDGIVSELKEHYCSTNRHNSYVLYGLSRTGKSSILDYLKKAIEGIEITGGTSTKVVLPLIVDLGAIYGVVRNNRQFWKRFIKTIFDQTKEFLKWYKPGIVIDIPEDFSQFILTMEDFKIHPLFMLDEFSFMQNIINAGYINSAFLQYMRTISADKDLASFIFAGTYDIKKLIHDPKYNISGAFTYLREPDKPLFEISSEAAEELINMMQGKLDFSPAAIREIHRLTGDVPFWIQKLCLYCASYGVDNNKPDIGIQDLEAVVCKMTGEPIKTSYNMSSIPSLNEGTFSKTQILDTDSEEIKIVLTSVSYLMKELDAQEGVTYEQIKALWSENNTDISNYNIKEALDSLCERKTLTYADIDNMRFYKFSIDLFRRWWLHEHFVFELQLSSFKRIVKNE